MSLDLFALTFDAADPRRLADFWSGVLGLAETADHGDGVALGPVGDAGFRIRFVPNPYAKTGVHNRAHFDLTSTSLKDQQTRVERALELGGRHYDVGQLPEEEHVVLADPEDNEFCVLEPGNNFLAGCGLVGALASDGTQAVGYFWSKALDWPLVWDQDEETAIQSPRGGTKITWGGPPVDPKPKKNRLHFDLVPTAGGDLDSEVARLESLGARRIDIGQGDVDWVVMADPDDNEFCVLPSV
jgi:hypothetical protein